jgi:hypothetical protein
MLLAEAYQFFLSEYCFRRRIGASPNVLGTYLTVGFNDKEPVLTHSDGRLPSALQQWLLGRVVDYADLNTGSAEGWVKRKKRWSNS